MIEIIVKTYKYGEYRGTETHTFNSDEEVMAWIESNETYTQHIRLESIEWEEDCSKWKMEYEYKGKEYYHDIDC